MAGPLEELVKRSTAASTRFASSTAWRRCRSVSSWWTGRCTGSRRSHPSPGFGFLTLCPHCDEGEPEELIVPLGAVREIRLGVAEPPQKLGFSLAVE